MTEKEDGLDNVELGMIALALTTYVVWDWLVEHRKNKEKDKDETENEDRE